MVRKQDLPRHLKILVHHKLKILSRKAQEEEEEEEEEDPVRGKEEIGGQRTG